MKSGGPRPDNRVRTLDDTSTGWHWEVPTARKHDSSTYSNMGCRCRPCKDDNNRLQAEQRASRWARRVQREDGKLVAPEWVKHGSPCTYFNWGCQCDPCQAATAYYREPQAGAMKVARKKARVDRKAARVWVKWESGKGGYWFAPDAPHHGQASYKQWLCRCPVCYLANSADKMQRQAKRFAERQLLDGYLYHPKATHGIKAGYRYWGCRCLACCNAVGVRTEELAGD